MSAGEWEASRSPSTVVPPSTRPSGRESFTYTGLLTGIRSRRDPGPSDSTTRRTSRPPRRKIAVTSDCPCTLFGAVTPITPATADTSAVTSGTKFTAASGRVHHGHSASTREPATPEPTPERCTPPMAPSWRTATFANETATGWQTVTFLVRGSGHGGHDLRGSLLRAARPLRGRRQLLRLEGYTSGKLTAPGGPSNPNGVYASGDRFPSASFKQTNYYVDAVFNSVDTTPLTVTTTCPPSGSTSVSTGSTVTETFSRAVTRSTASCVVIRTRRGESVPGTTSYDSASKTATFIPTQAVATGTTYTVTTTADPDQWRRPGCSSTVDIHVCEAARYPWRVPVHAVRRCRWANQLPRVRDL